MFTVEEVVIWARKMVERESRGNGDQINALDRVSRRCKMTPRSLRRLINGETKDPGVNVYGNVRAAYLEQMARIISEMQTELSAEQGRSDSMNVGLIDQEIADLAAKIEAARKGR